MMNVIHVICAECRHTLNVVKLNVVKLSVVAPN
jgi:hypothetical protein